MPNIDDDKTKQGYINTKDYYRYRNNAKYQPEYIKSNRIICRDDYPRDYVYSRCWYYHCNTDEIENILLDKRFGLPEIKEEVRGIECRLDNPHYGLEEIKKEIREIECKLGNPHYGLEEIKKEVKELECRLENPHYGLIKIKKEIKGIEHRLDNPCYGLEEIKHEVAAIEGAVLNDKFGLEKIKKEIKEIIEMLENMNRGVETDGSSKTTGPVLADHMAGRIAIKLFNNTATPKTVTATVFALASGSKTSIFTTGVVTVAPHAANEYTSAVVPENYEVEFTGLVPGVYGFTAAIQSTQPVQLIAANTFRHSELVPLYS